MHGVPALVGQREHIPQHFFLEIEEDVGFSKVAPRREGPGSLVTLNDSGNYSFQQIATIIDTTPLR